MAPPQSKGAAASCFYCGSSQGPFVGDHFLPRSKGGKGGPNIVCACVPCDKLKGSMHPREFMYRCSPEGIVRVKEKLKELGLWHWREEQVRDVPPDKWEKGIPPRKGLARDGTSTSDGPGGVPGQGGPSSLKEYAQRGMKPPPWSQWREIENHEVREVG